MPDELYTINSPKQWIVPFLKALQKHGVVTTAAQMAGIERTTAYVERSHNEEFRKQWDKALELGVEALEDIAKVRAFSGSDTLLIFLLKANRPDKYRETTKTLSVNVTIDDIRNMTDEQLDELYRQLEAATRR